MRSYGSGYLGRGKNAARPSADNGTDKLDLSELRSALEHYLKESKPDAASSSTSTLTLLKNKILYVCTTLAEREKQIEEILNAKSSEALEKALLSCWRENVWESGIPKGKLGCIISTHWNRLDRMSLDEKHALDPVLRDKTTSDIELVQRAKGATDVLEPEQQRRNDLLQSETDPLRVMMTR